MSQPLTFPCPFCGRRMGVGMELVGRHVRCPHCKQIVLAPSAAQPQAPAVVMPVKPLPDPVFNAAPKESADSILSDPEESDDEVFSSSQNGARLRIPDLPEPGNPWGINDPVTRIDTRPAPPPPPQTADANPFSFAPPAPPPVAPPRAEVKSSAAPTAEHPSLFNSFEPPPVPPSPAARGVAPAPPANPWSSLDAIVTNPTVDAPVLPPVPVPVPVFQPTMDLPDSEPLPVPVPVPLPRPQPAPAGGIPKGVFYAVAGYALAATALAVYGLFIKSGEKIDPGHPLSTIPDSFGEFDPAQRKKVSKLAFPVDGELPPAQRVALGQKLEIGQLEISPLRVAVRPLTIAGQFAAGGIEKRPPTAPSLVLTLRVRNTSDELAVFPLDPAFNRKEQASVPTPVTGLVVGGKTFWGGEIEWPFARQVKRMFEGDQSDDARPLKPKESRDYVVFTAADGKAPAALKSHDGTATWRVQVRRGLVVYRGKDVPVTAIVGVEFSRADVPGL